LIKQEIGIKSKNFLACSTWTSHYHLQK